LAITKIGEKITGGGSSNGKTEKKNKEDHAEKEEEDRLQKDRTWQRPGRPVWLL